MPQSMVYCLPCKVVGSYPKPIPAGMYFHAQAFREFIVVSGNEIPVATIFVYDDLMLVDAAHVNFACSFIYFNVFHSTN
jgi:hypothetical protein